MTMTFLTNHLPPELLAAKETLLAARKDVVLTKEAGKSRVAFYLFLLTIGALSGTFFVSQGVVVASDKEFWRAGLTAISVLAGFMITTMVFTGKIEVAKSLTLTEFRDVASKANYLLLYQIGTVANHLVCLSLMLFVPSIALNAPEFGGSVSVLCLALFFVSIFRSIFIPVQIIELHRLTHAALLREKRDEEKKKASGL